MKSWIKRSLPRPLSAALVALRNRWFRAYFRKSYAQEGEDLLLERFLGTQPVGFYVDVGAHHPKRFSNTYRLYCSGWRGINIDAIPGAMAEFNRVRPRDINIEAAVASNRREVTFYVFNDPALNTLERGLAMERAGDHWKITHEISLTTQPLSELLEKYLPPNTVIDVLTIDVEGLDQEVLESNDWGRYRPKFVLAECLGPDSIEEACAHPVSRFLNRQGYMMVAKTMNTGLYKAH